MADPRFFDRAGPFSLGALAALSGARLSRPHDGGRLFSDVAPLETAGPNDVAFLDNSKYIDAFAQSLAGAAFVDEKWAARAPPGMALLLSAQPYKAYARAAQAFYPDPSIPARRAPSAEIDPEAVVPADCDIGPFVVIGPRARVGQRCLIGAGTVIGAGVELGDDCQIGPQVTLSHCLIGARVVLHAGVRIGQAGFGFAPDAAGPVKVPQLGRVIIGDDVDIGANTTIDRGSGHDTVIGPGTMIDNLVQIGHNVVLGRGCVLAGQVGVSGSTRLGDFVMAGGQAGFAGHLRIGAGARIGAKAGLMRDVPPGETVLGSPAVPIGQFMRQTAVVQRLAKKKDER
ncbi:MAG: UDP-3-O-(3-hydroxymyristoyl)glucosamine N-acyltransferase [Alphaproteobacteria bacterium]|nr:UDP-3-O-(3-hydroxymyristoyl)glucosamine N-acyltransferase [Alphaproteobacteria bacterium]MBV9862714.1 UDP-3-O-(3-hydroxymyristoyl)glucosamine N-acyltransferase [Alphaproteobacteria bacterium]